MAELEAIERGQVELALQAGAEVEEDPSLGVVWVRVAGRGPSLNYAARVRWEEGHVAERLAAVSERMRTTGEWPVLTIAEGVAQPAHLPSVLAAHGWIRLTEELIMATRHPPAVPHLDAGLRVEAVTSRTALDCVRLETANFGLAPELVAERTQRLERAVSDGAVRAFLLRAAREPVASARLTPGRGVAALSAIGVAERHRRRGYGRFVTAVATRAGLATGHRLVWLSVDEANVAAVGLYRGMGFERSHAWSRWAAAADDRTVAPGHRIR